MLDRSMSGYFLTFRRLAVFADGMAIVALEETPAEIRCLWVGESVSPRCWLLQSRLWSVPFWTAPLVLLGLDSTSTS